MRCGVPVQVCLLLFVLAMSTAVGQLETNSSAATITGPAFESCAASLVKRLLKSSENGTCSMSHSSYTDIVSASLQECGLGSGKNMKLRVSQEQLDEEEIGVKLGSWNSTSNDSQIHMSSMLVPHGLAPFIAH